MSMQRAALHVLRNLLTHLAGHVGHFPFLAIRNALAWRGLCVHFSVQVSGSQ